jgi:hypothetical protein
MLSLFPALELFATGIIDSITIEGYFNETNQIIAHHAQLHTA